MFTEFVKSVIYKIRGDVPTKKLVSMGMIVGKNFSRMNSSILDPSHCWLIEIGDNVTIAPRVHILCHDASTKIFLGYTKIGKVKIGNNVFIGASAVILPGVSIGDNVIVGANSTVTHDIPSNSVVAGSPAKVICSLGDYLEKHKRLIKVYPCYDESYTLKHGISMDKRLQQIDELSTTKGYIV